MRRAGVVGWPIAHSRSPLIHGFWLKQHGLDGSYERIPVEPERSEDFFSGFLAGGLAGVNVTIPYKELAAAKVAELDPVAARLGAANTVWIEDGRVRGANTDVEGFVGNLDAELPGWDRAPGLALVLGAGGAAKAVVDGLVARGFDVRIANRTVERAEDLARRYAGRASASAISDANRYLPDAALVVNTTSLGMKGAGDLDLDWAAAPDAAVAVDIVYVPLETAFLAAARARGLSAVDGLGMLLHQAVPAFERFFGVRPGVTADLRRLVEADL